MNSRVWAPASSNEIVDRSISSISPDDVCIWRTTSSISASASAGWCTTRSRPSPMIRSSSSVTSVAISTMTCRPGSRPVISRSIHTNTAAILRSLAMPEVPVVRLDPDLPLPAYAHPGDAGADLVAREDVTIAARGGRAVIPTGVALAIPEGYAGFVLPRSGLALRHGITCLNTPGLVDAGYRDELRVILLNTDPHEPYTVNRGDRIAQLVIQRVEQADFTTVTELDSTARDAYGFGSTGR